MRPPLLPSSLTAAVLALALAPSPARASDEPGALEALDVVLPRAVERAGRSIVLLEVERDPKAARPLSPQDRMALGIGARAFDERYFKRPKGPVTGVVVGRDAVGALVATSSWNLIDAKSAALLDPVTGATRPASVLGRDENLDIVLVRVPGARDLEPIERVKGPVRVAATALLVARSSGGAPFATFGHVSALGRFRGDALQVSTRMSYGNVGGAIIDIEGRLVGIAARLSDRSRNGQSSGVGFAAPVDRILVVVPELAKGTVIARRKSPFIGVQIAPEPPEGRSGIVIAKVIPGGAAAKAGLEDGDVITILHGVELKDFGQLREQLDRLEVGERVIVSVYRASKGERDFTIVLGARPEGEE